MDDLQTLEVRHRREGLAEPPQGVRRNALPVHPQGLP
jgi:hypothetical protein